MHINKSLYIHTTIYKYNKIIHLYTTKILVHISIYQYINR